MSCHFLEGNYLLVCKAGKGVYVPSRYEIREYCKYRQHKICPHYLNAKKHRPLKPVPPRTIKIE